MNYGLWLWKKKQIYYTEMRTRVFNDNKIQDGADKRTYRVLFDRIHNVLPGFQARWDIERGVERLLSDLDRWMLDKTKFKQRDFYRLQQIEFLHKTKQIDDNLCWVK